MENPFEVILEKLEKIERAIEELNTPYVDNDEILLSRIETCELLKINFTTLWKHSKSGKLSSYGIGNRVYYKKGEVINTIKRLNE